MMIEPMFGAISLIVGILIGVGVLVIFPLLFLTLFTIKKVPPGSAGVRVGFRGYVISDTWIFRIPLLTRFDLMDISVQKLEIERKGQDGLICEDNIRADIVVAFYIKVNYPKVDYGEHEPDSPEGQRLFDQALESTRQAKFGDIQKVAQTVGCERATDIDKLKELFEAKFSEALKTAGKQMEFTTLYTDRIKFRDAIIEVIGKDLNGYALEDVAIDYLEQTPVETLDPNNVLDAEGIQRITATTSTNQEATNKRLRDKDMTINKQDRFAEIDIRKENVDADVAKRKLDQANEVDVADRTRDVEIAKARASAETAEEVEQNRQVSETASISANQEIQTREVTRDEVVMTATYGKDMTLLRLEQEKIESGEKAEVDRNRRVGVADQEKEALIIKEAEKVAVSKAGLEMLEKDVTTQHQQRLDIEYDMSAERAGRVLNIKAEREAQAAQKEAIISAEAARKVVEEQSDAKQYEVRVSELAQKEAAEHAAERIQITADAEAKASEKRNHAMQQEAQGTAAMEAASGVAEANVKKAMAEAKEADAQGEEALGLAEANVIAKQGEAKGVAKAAEGKGEGEAIAATGTAEGTAIEARGLAEGKSIEAKGRAEGITIEAEGLAKATAKTEMAKAIELFNKASQDHEEFRLQLSKDRDVDLAEIQIQKDVAEAQARVVGEALKSANIEIVGGEHDFFEKIVQSCIQGRTIDNLMANSQTLTDVKNTFFTGDPDRFKDQMRKWIKDLGVSSEDVKNLTVAAALTKLMSSAGDGGTRSLIRRAQKVAKQTGITDMVVDTLLGDRDPK